MSDASNANPESDSASNNIRKDKVAARILRRWRMLTGGSQTRDADRRTLVACSGGADSVALALVLSQIPGSCVIAHIRHDIRQESETLADLRHVRHLASRWGVEFTSRDIRVLNSSGNLEANARQHRYAALSELAAEHSCPYIATGHHADDQLETLLLHLMRGSGLRAMSGMDARSTRDGAVLLRPMLDVTHQELLELLTRAGTPWREDPTNQDTSLSRNRIRHELIPVMRSIDPQIATHASQWAEDLSQAQPIIENQLDLLFQGADRAEQGFAWTRKRLREVPDVLLGLIPRRVCESLGELRGIDSMTRRAIDSWIRSVKSASTDPTSHRVGPIVSSVDAHRVVVRLAGDVP
ncbi:MAG: tRNA lysidine(34) synthetase TilS [Phycisphaerales bacterium]